MAKKVTGIVLIIIGSIPFIMQVFLMFGRGPNMPNLGARGPGGNLPSGGMPPSGMPPGGGPPGGGSLLGVLGILGPHTTLIAIILIMIGIVFLTHKDKAGKR